ncbi:MAG: hypothetical protein FJ098_16260 [Deltaproteobacteria bacterium]|nr:hypothetical protein [Deltaproteobacteria bacterium]
MGPEIVRAGLIDLDVTVFFQLGLFLLLAVLLNRLAFQPLLTLFAERRRRTEGFRSEAAAAALRATRLEESVAEGLQAATRAGTEERNRRRDAAVAQETAALSRVRGELAEKLQAERDLIARERSQVLPEMERASRELAGSLATRLNTRV